MKRLLTFILTIVVLIFGALIVFVNPMDAFAIIVGMVMISVAILNLAVQVYFPPVVEQPVELKVVEAKEETTVQPRKSVKKKKK